MGLYPAPYRIGEVPDDSVLPFCEGGPGEHKSVEPRRALPGRGCNGIQ